MKRNLKALIIASVFIAFLAGGYQGAKAYQSAKRSSDQTPISSREYISLVSFNQTELVRIELPESGIILERKDKDWEALPPLPGPLNQSELNSAARSLAGLQAERIIEETPGDLSLYGLEAPQGRIVLTKSDGERIELLGGGMSPSRSGYYVMKTGDPKVYLVSSYSGSGIFLELNRIRDKTLFPGFSLTDVSRFSLESETLKVAITAKPEDAFLLAPFSTHIMEVPYATPRGVNGEQFEALLKPFQNGGIQEFIDPQPASLEAYGLDKPLRVFIETPQGNLDLQLGKRENSRRYARRSGETEVFTIYEPEALGTISAFTLIDKFALIVAIDRVDSFTIRGNRPELTGEIRRQGEETAYFHNSKQVEEKSFKNWYQKVIGLMIDAELPNRPQSGGIPEVTIEYTLNNPAGVKASIRLYPYNREFYTLESGGVQEFLVSRSQIQSIYEIAETMSYIE
ncbi:MAG: DUF4340 domain-containing protein [Treponema sp.]|jgi:hypothetical protein|nr:DUF4340 domain-containing protein [Treponema sp.]